MPIGDHFVWGHPGALDRLPKECLGAGRVTALPHEDIHHHAIFVDHSIQVERMPLADQEDLIHEPLLADRRSLATHRVRQLWPEGLDPVEHGAMGDIDATFGQQLQHLTAG